MGGSSSKKIDKGRTPERIQQQGMWHGNQRRREMRAYSHGFRTLSELTRAGSEMSAISPLSQSSALLKAPSSTLNIFSTRTDHKLWRTNNNSPVVSSQDVSVFEDTNKSKTILNTLNSTGNFRHTDAKFANPPVASKLKFGSNEKLRWKEQNVIPANKTPPQIDQSGGDITRKVGRNDSFKLPGKLEMHADECAVLNISSSPNLLHPTGSLLSLKSPKQITCNEASMNLSSGDVAASSGSQPAIVKRKRISDPHFLTDKPPTPPVKTPLNRDLTVSRRTLIPASRRYSAPNRSYPATRRSQSPSPVGRQSVPRTSALSRGNDSNKWIRLPRANAKSLSPVTQRRPSVSPATVDSDSPNDRTTCLSRIEYTFYIGDTEDNQRPFYDRRIEAVARASQCNICLHKPVAGYKPVYYKGNRVLPVTISSRTMIALKRCIARLDIQYPYFNVKAFCPPDMY